MTRWNDMDLATALSRNPALRLNRPQKPVKPILPSEGVKPATEAVRAGKQGFSKYGNRKTGVNGITFDSKKEAARYLELKTLQQAGKIRDLKLQPKYPLMVNGQLVANYIGDFAYWDAQSLTLVVEDTKGIKTPVYRLKKKLLLALYDNFEFRES